jgi:signal transduction histidine kinase
MKQFLKYLCICAFLWNSSTSKAQETTVDRNFSYLNMSRQVEILEDKSKQLTFEQIPQQKFEPHTKESINYGFTNAYYWIRFCLKNRDSIPVSLLLETYNVHLNRLKFYYKDNQGNWQYILTGDHYPFKQRPVNHPHFVFPIKLAPRQSADYYLWVDKHGEQIQIPLELHSETHFQDYSGKLFIFFGLMLGITGLFVLLSFVLFIFFRQKIILFYWLYTLSMWVFMISQPGLGFQYIWPEATWWTSTARPATLCFFYLFSLLFIRQFYPDLHKIRFLDITNKAFIIILCIYLIVFLSQNPSLGLFKNHWYNAVYYEGSDLRVALQSLTIFILVILWWTIGIGIYFYIRTRNTENLWFTFAYSMIFIGGTVGILIFLGIVPDNFITHNLFFIANPLEIITMSVLLANRYRNVHKENIKITSELAEQRQKNAIQLLEGQMIERKRLSQELHDGISLILANIRLRLSILTQKHPSPEMNELVDKLGQVGQDVRQFSQALSPVILEKYGLTNAIEELVQATNNSQRNVNIAFSHDINNESTFPTLITQTLYQITLELINNTIKHAQATNAQITLQENRNHILLKVSDDGHGYESANKSGGIGIQNIRARTQSLNGKFTISRQKKGMLHTVQIPVQTKLFS